MGQGEYRRSRRKGRNENGYNLTQNRYQGENLTGLKMQQEAERES